MAALARSAQQSALIAYFKLAVGGLLVLFFGYAANLFQHAYLRRLSFSPSLSSSMRFGKPEIVGSAAAIGLVTAQKDIETVYDRRVGFIVQGYASTKGLADVLENILDTATADGTWPDVDYTSGCPARRANWPAQVHWLHIIPLAAAYTGVLPKPEDAPAAQWKDYVGNEEVKQVLDKAMNWWFDRDYKVSACVDQGGTGKCPCSTDGLWNTNWYSNVILIPRLATEACLLLDKSLSDYQRESCVNIGLKGYGRFHADPVPGYMSGANILDVASNTVNVGILQAFGGNTTQGQELISEAYERAHNELRVQEGLKADGIRADGSFNQHSGILYNGNYGKDYANLVLLLELSSAGTQWEANQKSREAFGLHVEGSSWMMYRNTRTHIVHWDFSTVGRMIIFPTVDQQATASIKMNLTQVERLGEQWKDSKMKDVATRLKKPSKTANAGNTLGNRMFWINDYMVHRGENYVTTVKMLSKRTTNTECLNSQNMYGFHLGQGAVFTYVSGQEYEDVAAAWNWNIIPGITTDYAATPFFCDSARWSGLTDFVGGASDGLVGMAVMDYINPYTGTLRYRKAWFFFEGDMQHVTVTEVKSVTGADVYSVLDQKQVGKGGIYVNGTLIESPDGGNFTAPASLWHSGVGYTFDPASPTLQHLAITTENLTGDWSHIGTSTAPPNTVDLFTAYLKHQPEKLENGLSYTVYPGTNTYQDFEEVAKKRSVRTLRNDKHVSAAMDSDGSTIMAVFWPAENGHHDESLEVPWKGKDERLTIRVEMEAIIIVCTRRWTVTVADPSQSMKTLEVTIEFSGDLHEDLLDKIGLLPATKKLVVHLPQGSEAGRSVTVDLFKH
ncbi:hypothetical protein FS837_012462 [Tulasnella sp. UAMH 9824]|nr:hypothetical protein FS837_012462 [Tulasnella sp. UAMH 9824]